MLLVIVSESGSRPNMQAPKSEHYCSVGVNRRPADLGSKTESLVTGAQQAARASHLDRFPLSPESHRLRGHFALDTTDTVLRGFLSVLSSSGNGGVGQFRAACELQADHCKQ